MVLATMATESSAPALRTHGRIAARCPPYPRALPTCARRCVFLAIRDVYVSATQYAVESRYDYVTIADTRYIHNGVGPRMVWLPAGETMSWYADGSITYGGFTICAYSGLPPTPPPPPPSIPPYPPGLAPPASFHTLNFANCVQPIRSMAQCAQAALQLGLSDTTPSDDGQTGVVYDPPWCYYEGGSLKFNTGTNQGGCAVRDTCLCLGAAPPPPPTLPPPPVAPPGTLMLLLSGAPDCAITNGTCFTDGAGRHGNNERCSVQLLDNVAVTATQYSVEPCCDYLTFFPSAVQAGLRYLGTAPTKCAQALREPTNSPLPKANGLRVAWWQRRNGGRLDDHLARRPFRRRPWLYRLRHSYAVATALRAAAALATLAAHAARATAALSTACLCTVESATINAVALRATDVIVAAVVPTTIVAAGAATFEAAAVANRPQHAADHQHHRSPQQ